MKQVLQNLKSGATQVADVPCPLVRPGTLLIQTRRSLISSGTERMAVEFSKASLIGKARSQPDKVKQVLEKIKTQGLLPTLEVVFSMLDEPAPLGYCNSGVVLEVGPGVRGFNPGDRVASNGPHAEIACVPTNLCAKIPDGVTDDQAAFTVLSSIALQGVRLMQPALGEKVAVYGLGLIGLLGVQLLRSHGCDVLGVDIHEDRLRMAKALGAEVVNVAAGGDPVAAANAMTGGHGVDGVMVTAAAKTDEIMHLSAEMCRKRGRLVLVGVVGLNLRRSDFYAKEITFQVSCSYGPGRYDETYEQGGHDYPYGFVRWTEQRNFEAVLDAMRTGNLNVDNIVSHRFPITEAAAAFDVIIKNPDAMGVMLEYPEDVSRATKVDMASSAAPAPTPAANKVTIGVIGAGAMSKAVVLPSLSKVSVDLRSIASARGITAQHLAKRFGVKAATTDYKTIINDPAINTVIITTRHDTHAQMTIESLDAGKHTFVEKPLALTLEELQRIKEAYERNSGLQLMVGFNRRFSPHTVKLKELLAYRSEPLCMNMMVNAGALPANHWTLDPVQGGGRIIGEACHFIDLLSFIAGSPIKTVVAVQIGGRIAIQEDKMSIVLGLADGSVGTVHYFANGSKSYPKETLEVFSERRVLRLDDFQRLTGYGVRGFRKFKTFRQDKGRTAEFVSFAERVAAGGPPLIPFEQLENVTRAALAAVESAKSGKTIEL